MELTRTFSHDQYASALESWTFIDLRGMSPSFTSPFGDVFLRSKEGFWMLDLVDGALLKVSESREQLQAILDTESGQDDHLLAGLALAAEARGLVPQGDQVYGYAIPPVLGGSTDVENVQVIDFVVGVNIAGQVHAQTRHLLPGTRIDGFTVDGGRPAAPSKKPWFRTRR